LNFFVVTNYAAAQFTTFWLAGYGETAITDSNAFALTYAPKTDGEAAFDTAAGLARLTQYRVLSAKRIRSTHYEPLRHDHQQT